MSAKKPLNYPNNRVLSAISADIPCLLNKPSDSLDYLCVFLTVSSVD